MALRNEGLKARDVNRSRHGGEFKAPDAERSDTDREYRARANEKSDRRREGEKLGCIESSTVTKCADMIH